jgi:hypothetical protein
LDLVRKAPKLLQFAVIVMMSFAAAYAFQHTETGLRVNGLCFYRYFAYVVTIFLGYISFSSFNKYVGLAFSFALSVVALSPVGLDAVALFPSLVPFIAMSMGTATLLASTSSNGRGFFELLAVLVTPAVLAESRIGGTLHLLDTTQSVGYLVTSAIGTFVVGGYFYLRYAVSANRSSSEILSNGGDQETLGKVNLKSNLTTILVIIVASGLSWTLMTISPAVADVLRARFSTFPLFALFLATGAGIALTASVYAFKLSQKEASPIK